MSRYCCHCGALLREFGDCRANWVSVFECTDRPNVHNFIWVAHTKWDFPLLELGLGVKEKLADSTESQVKLAVSRLRIVDYKTVSIVGFEHTLLGCYRASDHVAS